MPKSRKDLIAEILSQQSQNSATLQGGASSGDIQFGGSDQAALPFMAPLQNDTDVKITEKPPSGGKLKDGTLEGGLNANVNLPLFAKSAGLGALDLVESLGNVGLAIANPLTALDPNVPDDKKPTVKNIVNLPTRITNALFGNQAPEVQTASEILESEEYQQELNKNLSNQIAGYGGQFGGGFLVPLGGFSNVAKTGAKLLPFSGGITRNVVRGAQGLPAAAQGTVKNIIRALPIALEGGAIGGTLTAGKQLGRNEQLNPQDIATSTGLGATLGLPLGMIGNAISKNLNKRSLSGSASSRAPESVTPQLESGQAGGAPIKPKQLKFNLDALIDSLFAKEAEGKLKPQQTDRTFRAVVSALKKRNEPQASEADSLGGLIPTIDESVDEIGEVIAAAQAKFTNNRRKSVEAAKKASESSRNKRLSRRLTQTRIKRREQRSDAKSQKTENVGTDKVDKSNDLFKGLADEIEKADSPAALDELEIEVHTPPSTSGRRLFTSDQINALNRFIRKARRKFSKKKKSEESGSGEDKGLPKGGKGGPTVKPPAKAITGMIRKGMATKFMPREERHKLALSAEKWSELGGFNEKEREFFKDTLRAIAEERAELEINKKKLEDLADFALKNVKKWDARQGDFLATGDEQAIKVFNDGDLTRAGAVKGLLFKVQLNKVLSKRAQNDLSTQKFNLLQEGFTMKTRTGKDGKPVRIGLLGPDAKPIRDVDGKPILGIARDPVKEGEAPDLPFNESLKVIDKTYSSTMGGVAKNFKADESGRLVIEKMEPIPSANPAIKDLNDLWNRSRLLQSKIKTAQDGLEELKGDSMDDGTTFGDLMTRIFEKQKDVFKKGEDPRKVPAVNVWNVDEQGNVVTVRYEQNQNVTTFNEATRDLELQYRNARAFAESLATRTKEKFTVSGTTLHIATGLEPLAIAPIAARIAKDIGSKIAKNKEFESLIHVGTIRDVIGGHEQFAGHIIKESLDSAQANILRAFHKFSDVLAPVKGVEDMVEIMNKFKGVKTKDILKAKISQETTDAERRTAQLIRSNYDKVAEKVRPVLEEMKSRKTDLVNGQPGEGRAGLYKPEEYANGRLRSTIHSQAYQDSLQMLLNGLTLHKANDDAGAGLINMLVTRKNASIFGNNIKVGFTNFFDVAPITLAEYGHHWIKASLKMSAVFGDKAVRQGVKKLPIIPQGELQQLRLQEQIRNRPAPENLVDRVFQTVDEISLALGTKLDPIFKGKEVLTGLADKMYSRTAVVASLSKQASELGVNGDKYIADFFAGRLASDLEQKAFVRIVDDLSGLYNTVFPNINRDMLAESTIGQTVAQYAKPQRRVMRKMYDWMTSKNPKDRGKFIGAAIMYMGMGGRAVIPASIRNMILYSAAAGTAVGGALGLNNLGLAQKTEDAFQGLDSLNVLRNTTGLDYTDRLGYDWINIASPALDDIQAMMPRAMKAIQERDFGGALWQAFGVSLSIFPKVGPVGSGQLNSFARNNRWAEIGSRPTVIKLGDFSKRVTIPYNQSDAIRDFFIAGPNDKVQELTPAVRKQIAKKLDQRRPKRNTGNQNQKPSPSVLFPGLTPSSKEL